MAYGRGRHLCYFVSPSVFQSVNCNHFFFLIALVYVCSIIIIFFPGTHLRKCFPGVLCLGFPDGPVAENPSANAGDTGSISGPGRSHMHRATKPKRHSYWSLCALESVLCNKGSHHDEKPGHHNWRAGPAQCNQRKPTHSKGFERKTQHRTPPRQSTVESSAHRTHKKKSNSEWIFLIPRFHLLNDTTSAPNCFSTHYSKSGAANHLQEKTSPGMCLDQCGHSCFSFCAFESIQIVPEFSGHFC